MTAERKAASKARPDAGRHAARIFFDNIPLPDDAIVSLYHPLPDELDTKPLADELIARGRTIALPVTPRKRERLIFRAYSEGDTLAPDRNGIMTPAETAPVVSPTIVVTPLLAFTRDGARLGYGGGYYDRTLKALRASSDIIAVGFAFSAQELKKLPMTKTDQWLDWIVTEREAINAGRSGA
ncbi:MAG: 5-formyltetrahydrofolate cyclo-ligase [Parvularculaceae bacterium]|nr:5-formyltetrahydrofolate cyclo-ligase [Parvularculaceae bacterium]